MSSVTLEIDIEEAACKAALKLGVTSIKIKRADQKGWPDRLFLIPGGAPLFIEFKTPVGVLSPHQVFKITRLESLGYAVAVCDTVEDAVREIKEILNRECVL